MKKDIKGIVAMNSIRGGCGDHDRRLRHDNPAMFSFVGIDFRAIAGAKNVAVERNETFIVDK